jgi:hypothetical protein
MTKAETKRLVAELEALPDYQGWTFVYEYPGYFGYRRSPFVVFFTPDWEGKWTLPIEVQDDEGNVYDAYSTRLPLPPARRTGRKLFNLVRPTLDKLATFSEANPPATSNHARKKTAAQLDAEIADSVPAHRTTKRNLRLTSTRRR